MMLNEMDNNRDNQARTAPVRIMTIEMIKQERPWFE